MEEKKYPTSKLLAIFVWVFPAIILGLLIWSVVTGKSNTTVTSMATMFVAAIAIAGYVVKCYMKKASLENVLVAFVRFMKCMLQLQKENPELEIYPASQLKADAKYISDSYKQEIQNSLRTIIQEDVTTKIT